MIRTLANMLPALALIGLTACVTPHPIETERPGEEIIAETEKSPLNEALTGAWALVAADNLEVRQVLLDLTEAGYRLNAGCNSMSGLASLTGSNGMTIEPGMSTLMGCPDNYETLVLERLTATQSYNLSGPQLTLTNANREGLIFERPPAAAEISGTWTVTGLNINGGVVSSVSQPEQTVTFDNGRLSGDDGCNRVGGTYEITGETIAISDLFSTRMACQFEDGYAWDRAYQDAMSKARKISWRGNSVELRDENGALLMKLTQ